MKKFWEKSMILYRNCEKIKKLNKISGEVLENFENITRNLKENFEKIQIPQVICDDCVELS